MYSEYSYYGDGTEFIQFITVLLTFSFIYFVLNAIVQAFLFKKAGKPAWGAFIPIYNTYLYVTTAFKDEYWYIMFLPFGFGLLTSIPVIGIFALIASLAYSVYLSYSFAKSFGRSTAQSVLFIFFPLIMGAYFAFNKNIKYVGKQVFITEKNT